MKPKQTAVKLRRALLSVSNKEGIVELAKALVRSQVEIIATGNTERVLKDAGIAVTSIEKISGCPEAFHGRMKTLSFPVFSGILYRRGEMSDEADVKKLSVPSIDCVVVNFYPFEGSHGKSLEERIELIDIGGPSLVRAAAKNAPSTVVLTHPSQYQVLIRELEDQEGSVSSETALGFASQAWSFVTRYDQAISEVFGPKRELRYGENPHQKAWVSVDQDSPIDWTGELTPSELSYNNILDLTAAYDLAVELSRTHRNFAVIVKHQNPCGVATHPHSLVEALRAAWAGDPVSAFGGVVLLGRELDEACAEFLSPYFIEVIASTGLTRKSPELVKLLGKRKNLKAVTIHRFEARKKVLVTRIPGGEIFQEPDQGADPETFQSVTKKNFTASKELADFGVSIARSLKSNAVAIVREYSKGGFQLVGAGQGQPNRIEAIEWLAIPRAKRVLKAQGNEDLSNCVLVSDAFFPFADAVGAAHEAGIQMILQPGGSIKDQESIKACDTLGVAMAFTGRRHFRHG